MSERDPLCFQCGHPVTTPPRVQYLATGEVCPQCELRFVDSLPSLLPCEPAALRGAEPEPGVRPSSEDPWLDDPRPA